MLMKLLKYEFRSIGRQLIPMYLGVLGLAVVNHFIGPFTMNSPLGNIPAVVSVMAYTGVCVALFVITILLIIQRFYKGLLTEEGYLMFTLPCKPWQLIAAKGIAATAMTVVGSCVGILSVMLIAMSLQDWGYFFRGLGEIPWMRLFQSHALWPLYIVELLIAMVFGLFSTVGHVYVSIAIGHLSNKHRIAYAILAYIGINMIWGVALGMFGSIMNKLNFNTIPIDIYIDGAWAAHLAMIILILSQLIPTAIYFFSTNWILSNKLNLE